MVQISAAKSNAFPMGINNEEPPLLISCSPPPNGFLAVLVRSGAKWVNIDASITKSIKFALSKWGVNLL
jgi:hypothetical protein